MEDFMNKLLKVTLDIDRLRGRGIEVLPLINLTPGDQGATPTKALQGQADQIMRKIVASHNN